MVYFDLIFLFCHYFCLGLSEFLKKKLKRVSPTVTVSVDFLGRNSSIKLTTMMLDQFSAYPVFWPCASCLVKICVLYMKTHQTFRVFHTRSKQRLNNTL